MNYGHIILPKTRIIYQVFEGTFSTDQLVACTRRLWTDPAYSRLYNGITDVSAMTPGATLENLHGLTAFLKHEPQLSQGRWAVITSTPIATAGAMIYKREMAAHHPFGVFSTWEAACAFLQLDLPARPTPLFFPELSSASPWPSA